MRKHEILLQKAFANLISHIKGDFLGVFFVDFKKSCIFANTKTDVLNIYEYKQESSLYVEVGDENADKPARSF
jgi:hypothetical protein